jgi:hypothetical protein
MRVRQDCVGKLQHAEVKFVEDRTEKEKMLAGGPYLASDPELREERRRARRLTRLYNQTTEEERERRTEILRELFGAGGANASIEPPFYVSGAFRPLSKGRGMKGLRGLPK